MEVYLQTSIIFGQIRYNDRRICLLFIEVIHFEYIRQIPAGKILTLSRSVKWKSPKIQPLELLRETPIGVSG